MTLLELDRPSNFAYIFTVGSLLGYPQRQAHVILRFKEKSTGIY